MEQMIRRMGRQGTGRIVLTYLVFGFAWIYGSARMLGWLVHDRATLLRIESIKGSLFVLLTGLLLYALLHRLFGQIAASEAARASQTREHVELFNATTEAIFVHDATTGKILDCNDRVMEMFDTSRDEVIAGDIGRFSHGDPPFTQADAMEKIRLAFSEGPQVFEWQCCTGAGATFWTEVSLRRATAGGGDRIIAVVRDISERKRSEAALREAEWKFRALFDNSPIGVAYQQMIYDESGQPSDYRFIDVNDKYVELMGVDPRGRTAREAIAHIASDQYDWFGTYGRVAKGGVSIHVEQRLASTGRWYDIVAFQYKPDHFITTFTEITERKQAEAELARSESRFRTLVECSTDVIYVLDPDGTLEFVSPAWAEHFGTPVAAALGRDLATFIHADDAAAHRTHIAEVLASGVGSTSPAFRISHGDGSWRHFVASGTRYIDHSGETRYLGIARDITGQVEAEQGRLQMERQLLNAQKLESLGILAGGIAHDFNNILTAIMGNVSFARAEIDPEATAYAPLARAEKAAKRAAALAKQLLVFAKGGAPIRRPVAIGHLLQEALTLNLSGSNIQPLLDLSPELPAVSADEGQLSQAFGNIIINAAQAMPDGGKLAVSTRKVTLPDGNTLGLAAGTYVRIVFCDEGCGIPAEHQGKIFDPYFTSKPGGSGLGLASTYTIVTRHGGHIAVASAMASGTSFTIHLPACDNESREEVARQAPAAAIAGSHTILVMDDDEMVRELAELTLKRQGYRVTCCPDGASAVAIYEAARAGGTPYSLVIMDLTIPGGMGGVEAARRILTLDPAARLVVSSGYSDDPVMANFADYGFCASLEKPYTVGEIARILEEGGECS